MPVYKGCGLFFSLLSSSYAVENKRGQETPSRKSYKNIYLLMTFANAKQNTVTLQSALFRFVAQRRELFEFSPHILQAYAHLR